MILTHEIIEAGKSKNGGWGRKQLKVLRVKWPLKKGWKSYIAGRDYPEAIVKEFLALKDSHLPVMDSELDKEFLYLTEGI